MKKTLTILLCGIMALTITGCRKSDNELGGDTPLTNSSDRTFTITKGSKNCVPVRLTLYDDGNYELFTTYQTCKPGQTCNMMLKYTKSIKGKYDYDIMKILEDDSIEIDKAHSMDNLPEYEIYLGNAYVEDGYGYYYTIEKGTSNKYLDELLNKINVNLQVCAEPSYKD